MAGTATAADPSTKMLRRLAKDQEVDGWEEMDRDELLDAVELPDDEDEAPAKSSKKSSKKASAKSSKKASAPKQRRAVEDEDDDEDDDDEPAPRRTKKASARPAKKSTAKSAPPAKKSAAKKAAPAKRTVAEETEPAENGNPFREGTNLWFITEELIKGGKRSQMVKRLKKKIDLKPRQRAGDDYDVDVELDRRVLIVGQILRKDHGFNVVRDGRGVDATIVAEAP
jgi:hypothetical protein